MKKYLPVLLTVGVMSVTACGIPEKRETIEVPTTKGQIQTEVSGESSQEAAEKPREAEGGNTEVQPETTAASKVTVETEANIGEVTKETQKSQLYELTGMSEEEAGNFVGDFVQKVKEGDKKAVADMICYPRMVTVSTGEHTVNNAAEFLPYYDEILTKEFQSILEQNDGDDFITQNGMAAFASGAVWFASVDGKICIMTIQNGEGLRLWSGENGGVKAG